MIRTLSNKWLQFADWLNRTSMPPLAEDEGIVIVGLAVAMDWFPWPIAGQLVLTTQRIFYQPFHADPFLPAKRDDIHLDDIQALGRQSRVRGLYGGVPGFPIITITLHDGERYAFQTVTPRAFEREITRLRPVLGVT